MFIFLDACAIIYLVEATDPFYSKVSKTIQKLKKSSTENRIAISRLSFLECRVNPVRATANDTLFAYQSFFNTPDLVISEMTRDVVDLATHIRAHHGLRTPDALQAASCLLLSNEHLFITGDKAFAKVHRLNVKII